MERLLRKKELVEKLGLAKSTVADWVTEFQIYIPTVKQGAVVYYRPEAADVLKAIKDLREKDYSKVQIMEMLAKLGFPITVEDAVEDIRRVMSQADARDTLLTVMQTIGQTVVRIGEQTERIDRHESRIDEQMERMMELQRTVKELQDQLIVTQAELTVTKEQSTRSIWQRIFKR